MDPLGSCDHVRVKGGGRTVDRLLHMETGSVTVHAGEKVIASNG